MLLFVCQQKGKQSVTFFFSCGAESVSDGCHYPTQWVYAGDINAPDEASCGVGGGDTRGLPAKWSVKARESLRLVRGQREEVGGREDGKEPAVSSSGKKKKKKDNREAGKKITRRVVSEYGSPSASDDGIRRPVSLSSALNTAEAARWDLTAVPTKWSRRMCRQGPLWW